MKKAVVGLLIGAGIISGSMVGFAAGTGALDRASGWYGAGSNFTVTATAASNSVFSGWSGNTNGCAIAGNQITLTADAARQIAALFSIARFNFIVASLYGTATPAVGSYTNDYGTVLNPSVLSPDTRGTTQYVCRGWTMTGNAPASGTTTNFSMTQTNAAALTWLWNTNYYLATSSSSGGNVDVGSAWYTNGASVAITASASNDWVFSSWSGDTNGCAIAGSVITAPMTQARAIAANFSLAQKTLQIVSPYGSTYPAVGTMSTNVNSTIICSVLNSPVISGTTQYVCKGWAMTGNEPVSGTGTNFTMIITNNAVLTWQWTTNYWIELNVTGN